MPRLKRDEIGVSVCPSVYLSSSKKPEETARDIRRKVSYFVQNSIPPLLKCCEHIDDVH